VPVAYDILRESVALIKAGRAEPVRSLTRRRRFAAMGVDVSSDVAASMFARRGVGCIHQEIHVLALRDRAWKWLGGGGSSSTQQLLADRPAALSGPFLLGQHAAVSSDSRVIGCTGAGGTLDDRGQDEPFDGGRWISHSVIRVSAEVATVEAFTRSLVVPWHGHVLLVWCGGGAPPSIVARSASGDELAELRAPSRDSRSVANGRVLGRLLLVGNDEQKRRFATGG
jgi:hypothetical protein